MYKHNFFTIKRKKYLSYNLLNLPLLAPLVFVKVLFFAILKSFKIAMGLVNSPGDKPFLCPSKKGCGF